MKKLTLTLISVLFSLSAGLAYAQAQQPKLADRHVARGVPCQACHPTGPQPGATVETAQCLKCHQSREVVAGRTQAIDPNPHANHMVEQNCTECHSGHGQSQYMCSKCHNLNRNVP